jgi:hypothetical protein
MDERETIIEDFMNWITEAGYELSFFDPEYEKREIIKKQAQREIINAYLLTTAKTKQWSKDALIDNHEK